MSRSDHKPHTPASTSTPPTPTALSSASSLPPPFSTTSVPRLQALYSDFARQKHSNPESYHANVDWWRRALEVVVSAGMQQPVHLQAQAATPRRRGQGRGMEDADEAGDGLASNASSNTNSDRLVLHAGRELIERVKLPKAGKPLALGAVLSELLSTRSAIPLLTFLSAKTSIYDPGWLPARIAAYVVGRPLWWALEQMGVVGEEGLFGSSSSTSGSSRAGGVAGRGGGSKDTGWWGAYVLVALVEKAADEVEALQGERQGSAGDALYTMDCFRQVFKGVFAGEEVDGEALPPMRETDAKVLLKYLERDRGVLVVDKDVIKFVDKHASAEERTITAVDSGILELKRALENLQTQVDSLQRKIDDCTRKASAALQQKRKPAALSYLRSRKQFEDLLNKRLGSLHTLQATFITVEAAAGDVEIMKSYESSTATLRTILAHPALARASIDGTLEALAEATADAREVDEAVRFGGDVALGVGEGVDEDELERELAAMVREAQVEKEKETEERTKSRLDEVKETPVGVPEVEEAREARAPVPASS